MRLFTYPLISLLLGLLLVSLARGDSHIVTNDGGSYDVVLNRTCFTYTLSCSNSSCLPITSFDLDCNCPISSSNVDLSPSSGSSSALTWQNSTQLTMGGSSTALDEAGSFQVDFCISGHIPGRKQAQFVIKTVIIIIIGEIIVPDCNPSPSVCPTETPTETPTPTPTEEPTQPQGSDVCELIITPSTALQINSSTQFQVTLGAQPDGQVSVTVSSSCVILSSCLIVFNTQTWNVPQVITVYRNPAYQLSNNCTIELDASGAQECNTSIPVTILPQNNTPSQSWADPHVITLDGNYYRAFGTGDFYFVRQFNGNLVIQTRQTKCGPASCNTAVVIRFGSFLYYSALAPNGLLLTQVVGNAAANGITVTNSDRYRIYFPGGGFVAIQISNDAIGRFLNIVANLPDLYRGQIGGLVGNFDGNPDNDYTLLQTGAPASDLQAFLASNLVPEAENLFADDGAVIPLLRGASPPQAVVVGPTCTRYSPPNDITPTLQASQASSSPFSGTPLTQAEGGTGSCTFPNETVHQAAIKICSSFFEADLVSCCSQYGVSQGTYLQSCLCDYALTQAADFVAAHLLAYASTCETAANAQYGSCSKINLTTSGIDNLPPCESNPCLNGGSCTNLANNGVDYECDCAGTGFQGPRCQKRVTCPALASNSNAMWPQAFAKKISWGKCLAGFVGKPYRSCLESGQFGPVTNPCIPADTQCEEEIYHNAQWPPTRVTTFGQGVCLPGFRGSPTRLCQLKDGWASYVLSFCHRLYCPAGNAGGATWKTTPALKQATRRCHVGYGVVNRTCLEDGTWGDIQGECAAVSSIPCAPEIYNRAMWNSTEPGQVATGVCIEGWTGSPKRICGLDGKWQTSVNFVCVREKS